MNNAQRSKAFTLLELIIVIIIVGVLASLALPRLFRTIEFSRSTEALNTLGSIRRAMERCAMMGGNIDYTPCLTWNTLGLEDPSVVPGTHFSYRVTLPGGAVPYTITATRNTIDGGDGSSLIMIWQLSGEIFKSGSGVFSGIQ